MTNPRPGSRAEQRRRTEARILDAAASVFVAAGYERATIRAVASAAGVDAGLVMHYFGSKQELYRRVIDAAPLPEVSGAPEEAVDQILATLAGRLASEPTASLALLRSMLTNPEAASVASVGMARYQAQIADVIPADDASLRASIISAVRIHVLERHPVRVVVVLDDLDPARPNARKHRTDLAAAAEMEAVLQCQRLAAGISA
jgi:AcrR family transcriptional regulator